jgi:hypothetical protein
VAEAEANVGDNRDSGGSIDGDSSGNFGISGGGGNGGQRQQQHPKKGSAVEAAVTVATAVADNNRNCRGRQQSTKCGSSSGRDRSCGSGNHGSATAMAGRGRS